MGDPMLGDETLLEVQGCTRGGLHNMLKGFGGLGFF